jgi:hypothetical protein
MTVRTPRSLRLLATVLTLFASHRAFADKNVPSVTESIIAHALAEADQTGDLDLSHLQVLPPDVAELLPQTSGIIRLNGLKSLSPEAAAALAEHGSFLRLDGLET